MSRQAQDTHQHDEENATSTAEADVAIELVNEVPPPPPLPLTDVAEIVMKTPRQTNSISKHKIQIAIGVVVLSIIAISVGLSIGLSNRKGSTTTSSNENAVSSVDASPDDAFVLMIIPTQSPVSSSSLVSSSTTTTTTTTSPVATTAKTAAAASSLPVPVSTSLPTQSPITYTPTSSPFLPFPFGESLVTLNQLGLQVSEGLSVRIIAIMDRKVRYTKGEESSRPFHRVPDAAGIISLLDGGYVYMSNSEIGSGEGGVYGVYIDNEGNVVDYRTLLDGTSKNCGGGVTPWNTWISCEEVDDGQCWQVSSVESTNQLKHLTKEVSI